MQSLFSRRAGCGGIVLLFLLTSCQTAPVMPPATLTVESPLLPLAPPSQTPDTSHLTPDTSPLTPDIIYLCSPLAVQPLETIGEIITQPFLAPRQLDDGTYKDDAHHGLDLGYYTRDGELFTGTPVLSAANGRVAALILDRPPYGNAILVETPFGQIPTHVVESQSILPGYSLYVLYAHLQNLATFNLQQEVACGDLLAETGLTGFTGGPHLHFETRWGPAGQTFDSMAYYHVETTEEERANYVLWRMSGTFRLFDPMILLSPPTEN